MTGKKVLLISNYSKSIGGISGQVEILQSILINEGYFVKIFNTKGSFVFRIYLQLKLFISGIHLDVFHIHGCSYKGFLPIFMGTLAGKLLNKKLIVTYHGGDLKEFIYSYPKFVRRILLLANIVTVPSPYLFNILEEYKIPSIILPNIISGNNVSFKKRLNIQPNLIVTRSLEKVYNISLAIKAFSKIKKKNKDSTLRIVGDGSEKESLSHLIKELNLDDVIFIGRVENSKIGEELNKADIYISPSTKDSFAVSMFEAFGCGLPVISTNVGAISNYLVDGENGLLIDSDNTTQLVSKIEYILENPEHVQRIISNGYETFKKYSLKKQKKQYVELYK